MFLKINRKFPESPTFFNVTPLIDVVFLLIIFFLVVYKFIEAENFPVRVPQGCEFAADDIEKGSQVITLTVALSGEKTDFAIGAEKIAASTYPELVSTMAAAIDARIEPLPAEQRVVTLRIDKDVPFAQAQYALAAVAKSLANDIKIATLKDMTAELP